jgi:hypothetical protein
MHRAILFVLSLGLDVGLGACGGSSNYGAPTSSTTVDVQETGGFAGPSHGHGFRVVGATATYNMEAVTDEAALATSDVAAMIRALEDAAFLDLQADYTTCMVEITDLPTATITATLSAGSNTVHYYLGCKGGKFDDLAALVQQLFELSGYNAWAAKR